MVYRKVYLFDSNEMNEDILFSLFIKRTPNLIGVNTVID